MSTGSVAEGTRSRARRLALLGGTWLLACLLAASLPGTRRGEAAEPAKAAPPAAAPPAAQLYRLRVGDEIAVSVSPQKEFDCGGVVLPDERVYLKNLGPVRVVGMTVQELEKELAKLFGEELVNPEVRVVIVRLAPTPAPTPVEAPKLGRVTLVGAVGRSGPMELEPGLRLRKALDLAGGARPEADLARISVLHPDLTRSVVDLSTAARVTDPKHNLLLRDGDSIEVPFLPPAPVAVKNPVRVEGEVQKPGQVELREGMTLQDLLLSAGGTTPLADLEQVELRRAGQKPRRVSLPAQAQLGLDGKVLLEPGDEVFVPELKSTILLLGAVEQPGPRPLKSGRTIREFFLESKDLAALTPGFRDLHETQVIRAGEKKPLVVNLPGVLKSPKRKDNITLQPGDIVFLPPRINRNGGVWSHIQQIANAGWGLRWLTGAGF